MKVQYKNGETNEILEELELGVVSPNISDEEIKRIERFNEYEIDNIKIEFVKGILTKQTHDLARLDPKFIKQLTVTVYGLK